MASKKLINSVETCVDESINGYVTLHPGFRQLAGYPRVVVRSDIEQFKSQGRVTTVTGGGSGHEPTFFGYVGEGMMSSAVHGSLFASPGSKVILAAIRAIGRKHPAGVIAVFNNYTGDRLNFGLAVERAQAEGIRVEMIICADDCAVSSEDKSAGRRGLSGLMLIMKIVGHLAESGERIERIVEIATAAKKQVATMGVCLSPCSLPGGDLLFTLGHDEMELGMGMHGEAGMKRVALQKAKDVVKTIISNMTDKKNSSHIELNRNDRVAVLFNNMGATSDLEMNIVSRETIQFLESELGLRVHRAYAGKFCASMEMAGFSITIMVLDELRARCLDSATTATAWIKPVLPAGMVDRMTPEPLNIDTSSPSVENSSQQLGEQFSVAGADVMRRAVREACSEIIENTQILNHLDSVVGDGDCGSTLANGAKAVTEKLESTLSTTRYPCEILNILAETVEQSMGGTSGPLYSLLLTATSRYLSSATEINATTWGHALKSGIEAVSRYSGAEPGDRTMLDTLHAAWVSVNTSKPNTDEYAVWKSAVEAAADAADKTAHMKARAGRASYVSPDLVNRPDAGAKACAIWMSAILKIYGQSLQTA